MTSRVSSRRIFDVRFPVQRAIHVLIIRVKDSHTDPASPPCRGTWLGRGVSQRGRQVFDPDTVHQQMARVAVEYCMCILQPGENAGMTGNEPRIRGKHASSSSPGESVSEAFWLIVFKMTDVVYVSANWHASFLYQLTAHDGHDPVMRVQMLAHQIRFHASLDSGLASDCVARLLLQHYQCAQDSAMQRLIVPVEEPTRSMQYTLGGWPSSSCSTLSGTPRRRAYQMSIKNSERKTLQPR